MLFFRDACLMELCLRISSLEASKTEVVNYCMQAAADYLLSLIAIKGLPELLHSSQNEPAFICLHLKSIPECMTFNAKTKTGPGKLGIIVHLKGRPLRGLSSIYYPFYFLFTGKSNYKAQLH